MTAHVRPADLVMQVKTVSEHGRTRLIYTLDSPTGRAPFSHQEITGPSLLGRPEEYQARLRQKIEQLGKRLDVDDSPLLQADIERKLASLGHDLWRELLPSEIHHAYRDIRDSVRSWMIISDEPWIPWELIKPYEDNISGDTFDDEFLACRFELTRWLAGKKRPAPEIVVHRLVALRTAMDLPHANEELSLLKALAQSTPGLQISTTLGSAGDLLGFLEDNEVDLIHFTGHGLHSAEQADESGVPFPDGSVLRPSDLGGSVATGIGRSRPLIFLNACWGGQQGWSWTRLGGWAARWVGVCGCGAFIAPLWPARDKAALAFAETFYAALVQGATLGQAALEARRHLREARPGDPSALAYAVYGHPNACLRLGGSAADTEGYHEPPPLVFRKPRPSTESARRSSAPLRSRKAWAATLLLAGLLVALATLRFPGLWKSPGSTNQKSLPAETPVQHIQPTPTPTPAPPPPPPDVTKAGGITFEIVGGSGTLKSTLKQALKKAAAPLADNGISGWTVHLAMASPQITSIEDGQKSCRLVAQGRARRPGASLDLGSVPAVNTQTDSATACDAAAETLADAVVYQLVNSIRKGNS